MSKLGDLIKAIRTEQRLTHAQMAARCNLSHGLFSGLETGRRRYLRQQDLDALAAGLGIPLADLLASLPPGALNHGTYIPLYPDKKEAN